MADLENERLLRREMAKALDVKPSELEFGESSLSSFRAGDAVSVRLKGGGTHGMEWTVVGDEDTAEAIAKAVVRQDLESEPEIFNKDFIARHVNVDRLRRDLMSDVQNMRYEDLKEAADRRPIEFMKENDIEIPEPTAKQRRDWAEVFADEDKSVETLLAELDDMSDAEDRWITMGEEPEVPDDKIEEVAEAEAEERLRDPIGYLEEIYGDEAAAKAIEIAGIDIDSAVDEAIRDDGWQHFLARYDNNYYETPKGYVWWRDN